MSELYGRVLVLHLAHLFYTVFTLACGFSRTSAQLIVFRFLAGFGGSASLAIGGGVLSDLFTNEERGKAMSLYNLAPSLGPAIGPIAGGLLSDNVSWRWIFYVITIAAAVIQIAGLFFLPESYAPVLLHWRKNKLIKATGNTSLYTEFDSSQTKVHTLGTAMVRPFRMIFTQPIIQVLALYNMYLYGLLYLVLSTFTTLWTQNYGMRVSMGVLNYIALGVGLCLGAQLGAPVQDRVYVRMKRRYRVEDGRPEFRIPIMIPGATLVPVGLVIYGWTAQYRTLWIGPDVGIALFAFGVIVGFQCVQNYITDTYPRYAASATAATTVLRSLAGFGFPLFGPSLYEALDYGWGNTTLAFIAVALGWSAPVLLWFYGPTLRARSTFAAGE